MPCIICLIALAGLGVTALVDETTRNKNEIIKRLDNLASTSELESDTESVTKWVGSFNYTFEDGMNKDLNAAIYFYNEENKAKLQIMDHSLNQDQAEEFQDFICGHMQGEILNRNYPHSFDDDHHHDVPGSSGMSNGGEENPALSMKIGLQGKRSR